MLEIEVHDRLDLVPRDRWDACFSAEPEGFAYLQAVERAGIPGFELFYLTVRDSGRTVAAAPGFVTDYRLDTTLEGGARRLVSALDRLAPALTRLKLACLGSPVTETAALGLAPDAKGRERELLGALVAGLQRKAETARAPLQAIKDVPARADATHAAARAAGLAGMASLPTAVLELRDIPDEAAYWARLSAATRKDLRRKLKRAGAVQVERVTDLGPWSAEIEALYAATRARAALNFETLSWRYFQAVLEALGPAAACFLYRVEGELIAFNLLIEGGGTMVDKYFCAAERAREFDLYFVSWLHNVRFALGHGVDRLVAGQACYEPKLRLGCALEPTTIWFRHRSAPVNAALRLASRTLSALDRTGPAQAAA